MRLRIRRSAGFDSVAISTPSNRTAPAVGSIRRSSRRPVVDLPQPDSPTRPSVSPRAIDKIDAVDGADRRLVAGEPSAAPREILGEACRFDQRAHAASPGTR